MPAEAPPATGKGLQALLEALARLDDDEEDHDEPPAPSGDEGSEAEPASEPAGDAPDEPDDQSIGAEEEARGLLELLVRQENLEIVDDADLGDLVEGVTRILALPLSPEAKATKLSAWLLEREEVADLYIGDEDLAGLLERW